MYCRMSDRLTSSECMKYLLMLKRTRSEDMFCMKVCVKNADFQGRILTHKEREHVSL
jgi:hypothetical protein